MLATIRITPYIFLQGLMSRHLPNGTIAVLLDGREYVGQPVTPPRPVAVS